MTRAIARAARTAGLAGVLCVFCTDCRKTPRGEVVADAAPDASPDRFVPAAVSMSTQPGFRLVLDGDDVYWTGVPRAHGITRTSKSTGAHTALSKADSMSIAVDDAYVYFIENDDIRRLPKAGGEATTIVTKQASASSLVVDATHLYWTVKQAGTEIRSIVSQPKSATAASPRVIVTDGPDIHTELFVDASSVYWISAQQAFGAPREGGPRRALSTAGKLTCIVGLDAHALYALERTALDGALYRVMLDGTSTSVVIKQSDPIDCATFVGAQPYFVTSQDRQRYRHAKRDPHGTMNSLTHDGSLVPMAGEFVGCTSIGADDSNVYWLADGGLYRARR